MIFSVLARSRAELFFEYSAEMRIALNSAALGDLPYLAIVLHEQKPCFLQAQAEDVLLWRLPEMRFEQLAEIHLADAAFLG